MKLRKKIEELKKKLTEVKTQMEETDKGNWIEGWDTDLYHLENKELKQRIKSYTAMQSSQTDL